MLPEIVTIEAVRDYWNKKNIPQQWYSRQEPFTLPWFNELSYKRYTLYYPYLKTEAEFEHHSGEQVLEIGCGIGTDLVEYAKHGAIVTGVDLGLDQIQLTKLNFQLRGLPYRELREANVEQLPFADNSFDLVVCLGVLHHTPNTEQGIKEIYRVLKPDGKAIILVYARGWKHYFKRCFIHGILRGRWFAHRFNWKKVYSEIAEVHGNTPKTDVYTKRQVKEFFKMFPSLEVHKRRMGEFFEYKPYNTVRFPHWVNNLCQLFDVEAWLGENWFVKAQKIASPQEDSLRNVFFKHY